MGQMIFFIIGASRSGTTAVTKILNLAENGKVFVEQDPKMCVATRQKYEGTLPYPEEYIYKSKSESIKKVLSQGLHYGDKSYNYLFFIDELLKNWDCKFVFVFRNGKDVVRSRMNLHLTNQTVFYERYEDNTESILTEAENDLWDFGRLRPLTDDAIYSKWRGISKFEKFCWQWKKYNKLLFRKRDLLSSRRYINFFIDKATTNDIEEIFYFLNLTPFKKGKIKTMLTSNINTSSSEKYKFPEWKNWEKEQKAVFESHCSEIMEKLEYA